MPATWREQIVDALSDFQVGSELVGNPMTFMDETQ